MGMQATITKKCAVTRKGQTTLPLSVRQLLGVPEGGHVVVRATEGRVTIEPAQEEHRDPAIGTFLRLLEKDIVAGRNVGAIPNDLLERLEQVLEEVDVDLDEPIEGEVCL